MKEYETRYGALSVIGSRARWALTAVCLALGGCGNAHEHISVGEWREVGKAQSPESHSKGAYVVTTQAQGSGPAVEAGDLVQARVQPLVDPLNATAPPGKQPEAQTVWVWTGQEPTSEDSHQHQVDLDTFGDLGTARARAALIGRRRHERFEIHLEPGSTDYADQFPLRGISEDMFSVLKSGGDKIAGKPVTRMTWPALPLVAPGLNKPAAVIEILTVCKAKLLRRAATLKQFGAVFATGDARYASAREGTLGWSAIEAQCPEPDGHVRFQAGPFYHTGDYADGTWLADWSSSYVKLRPPQQHPEEWQAVVEPAWMVINKRLDPIRNQIVDLDSAQRRADLDCLISKKCETAAQKEQRRQQRDRLVNQAVQREKALECELEKKCD